MKRGWILFLALLLLVTVAIAEAPMPESDTGIIGGADYHEMPESLKDNYADVSSAWGFCWKEFVMTVPSPMFLVTTYKSDGQTNACMQSWATFTSANRGKGFYAILGSVNKGGHLYATLTEKKVAVINFFSADLYESCMSTIRHNEAETDEISAAGLTAEPAEWVSAPMVRESGLVYVLSAASSKNSFRLFPPGIIWQTAGAMIP